MRLFAAVFPPLAVRRDIVATLGSLPAAVDLRLTPAEKLHFTLAFFGEQPAGQLSALRLALQQTAVEAAPFRARISGLSGFPPDDRARVLFAALSDGAGPMSTLRDGLLARLGAEPGPQERGPFQPHLTLSRPRRPLAHRQFETLRDQLRPWSWDFDVDALALVESVPGPGGARYTVHAACGLGP